MRFRVSSRDLIIFVLFCVLLLYLCCIAVLNFASFANHGVLYGLNPFPAFVPPYLPVTLTMFFIALIIIFTSVSSYIFSREKGKPGLKIGEKNDKGYSRWAKDKEIKTDKDVEKITPFTDTVEHAGVPLINNGKEIWVDDGAYHNLVIGATGSGKTECLIKPMVNILARRGESMIITDPKGEIYQYSAENLKERGYKIIVLNFRDPQNGNAWNPLTLPYQLYKDGNRDKSTELLDDVALNILYDPNNKAEPFWEKSAADYFSGLALGLFEDAKEEQINLNSINFMSTVGEEKFAAGTYVKEYFGMKGESSSPYVFASNTINAPTDTKGGILSVFRQKIRLFASRENLSEMLSHSDFDMRDIGKEKTAIFIVIHDEKTTYHSLATIFIKQCYESLVDVAQENGGKLPYRTNFILDEFANMPPLKDVTTMVTAARSRGIRFSFVIQNFAQLKEVYGDKNSETIKGNCGNLIYLISTELAALEEISKMCGEVKSGEKDKTASTPLVTVSDLQKLKLFETIIIRWRLNPFRTKLTPNFEMNWGKKYGLADFPVREKQEVGLFDLKEFVKEKKRQQMLASLDGNPQAGNDIKLNGTPGMPGGFNDPFAPMPPIPNSGANQGFGNNIDFDAMMRDIDRKIAELDAEEARQRAKLEEAKKNETPETTKVAETPKVETSLPKAEAKEQKEEKKEPVYNIYQEEAKEEPKKEEQKQEEALKVEEVQEEKKVPKPKVNIDVDSVIVNDNIISDDEFFDDFFGDDE